MYDLDSKGILEVRYGARIESVSISDDFFKDHRILSCTDNDGTGQIQLTKGADDILTVTAAKESFRKYHDNIIYVCLIKLPDRKFMHFEGEKAKNIFLKLNNIMSLHLDKLTPRIISKEKSKEIVNLIK